jgi:hypothetical protein
LEEEELEEEELEEEELEEEELEEEELEEEELEEEDWNHVLGGNFLLCLFFGDLVWSRLNCAH